MDLQFIEVVWHGMEVMAVCLTSLSVTVIATCAVIHAFRTRPSRQVALFRNAFKIKAK